MSDVLYTKDHEWVVVEGDIATVGITAYAAEKLGDVVYVDLPVAGVQVASGRVVGEIESTKSVGELFAPFAHHDVVALADSELCVFPKSEMGRAVDLHPKLAQALLRRSQEELLQSRELLALSGRRSATGKVAGFLMGLAEAASDSSMIFTAARLFGPRSKGSDVGP